MEPSNTWPFPQSVTDVAINDRSHVFLPPPGLSVVWVIPEALVALPLLTPIFIICDGDCPGFDMFWLAVLESVLVYRTLPGLLERGGVERSGEDMEVLEERVKRALVQFRED